MSTYGPHKKILPPVLLLLLPSLLPSKQLQIPSAAHRLYFPLAKVVWRSFVIVMTHWPVSGACFWYQSTGTRNWSVCHTFLVPDFSGARNWHRLGLVLLSVSPSARKKPNFCKIGIHLWFFSVGSICRLCASWCQTTGACFWPMCHQLYCYLVAIAIELSAVTAG